MLSNTLRQIVIVFVVRNLLGILNLHIENWQQLNEKILCNLYKNKSVTQFRTWINHRVPRGIITSVPGMSVSINYTRYEFFRIELENLGLKWKRHGSFSSNDVLDYITLM